MTQRRYATKEEIENLSSCVSAFLNDINYRLVKLEKKEFQEFVIQEESAWDSAIKDIATFGSISMAYFINFKFIGGDLFLSATLFIAFWLYMIKFSKIYQKPISKEEALNLLKEDDGGDNA
jgi:hypothetical protein